MRVLCTLYVVDNYLDVDLYYFFGLQVAYHFRDADICCSVNQVAVYCFRGAAAGRCYYCIQDAAWCCRNADHTIKRKQCEPYCTFMQNMNLQNNNILNAILISRNMDLV